jgi:hypothetical protein
MSTLASSLLDFILDLFRDPAKAAAYAEDPQGALDAAGLTDVSPDDVADLMPMVSDYSTVGGWGGGSGDACDDEGGRPSGVHPVRGRDEDEHHSSGGGHSRPDRDEDDDEDGDSGDNGHSGGGHGGGHETVVITHLQEIQYTNHETHVEIDASHSIWVSGDAQAIFGDDNVLVGGDGVAAGGDVEDVTQIDNEGGIVAGDDLEIEDSEVEVDNSDNSVHDSGNTTVDVDIEDSPINVGSGNQAVDSGNGNEDNDVIADRGGQVGDDVDVEVDDVTVVNDSENVGNTTTVDDSFDDESVDVDIEDSFQDNSDNSTNYDVEVEDSFQDNSETDNSVDVDVDAEFEDSFTSEDNDFSNNDANAFAADGPAITQPELEVG